MSITIAKTIKELEKRRSDIDTAIKALKTELRKGAPSIPQKARPGRSAKTVKPKATKSPKKK